MPVDGDGVVATGAAGVVGLLVETDNVGDDLVRTGDVGDDLVKISGVWDNVVCVVVGADGDDVVKVVAAGLVES